jgi:hypothetical protein
MLWIVSEQNLEIDEELCACFRLTEGNCLCKIEQINADPKTNWYQLVLKKKDW